MLATYSSYRYHLHIICVRACVIVTYSRRYFNIMQHVSVPERIHNPIWFSTILHHLDIISSVISTSFSMIRDDYPRFQSDFNPILLATLRNIIRCTPWSGISWNQSKKTLRNHMKSGNQLQSSKITGNPLVFIEINSKLIYNQYKSSRQTNEINWNHEKFSEIMKWV